MPLSTLEVTAAAVPESSDVEIRRKIGCIETGETDFAPRVPTGPCEVPKRSPIGDGAVLVFSKMLPPPPPPDVVFDRIVAPPSTIEIWVSFTSSMFDDVDEFATVVAALPAALDVTDDVGRSMLTADEDDDVTDDDVTSQLSDVYTSVEADVFISFRRRQPPNSRRCRGSVGAACGATSPPNGVPQPLSSLDASAGFTDDNVIARRRRRRRR